jgi:DNA-binding NtrC family response regulator
LRERLEDIPIIADRLLDQLSWDMKRSPLRISESARLAMLQYSWPGNIRELRNLLERAALLSDEGIIHETGLEFELRVRRKTDVNVRFADLTLKEMEKRYILQVLESEGRRVAQAARRLGIPRSSLYAKIRELGL